LRKTRLITIVFVGAIIVIAYMATVGWSEPVKDFQPETPSDQTPSTNTTPPANAHIAYATFAYSYTVITAYSGAIQSCVPSVQPYVSPSEGRVYQHQTLMFAPFPPFTPEPNITGYIYMTIWGNGLLAHWQSDTFYVTKYPTSGSGESGRVFFDKPGTYTWSVDLVIDSGAAGDLRTVAVLRGTVEVNL